MALKQGAGRTNTAQSGIHAPDFKGMAPIGGCAFDRKGAVHINRKKQWHIADDPRISVRVHLNVFRMLCKLLKFFHSLR